MGDIPSGMDLVGEPFSVVSIDTILTTVDPYPVLMIMEVFFISGGFSALDESISFIDI